MASRRTRVRFDQANAAMTVFHSRYWARRGVYILRADKPQKYESRRSRIVYIGETRKGAKRPAASAAGKSLKAFAKLRGVKRIEVYPLTFRGKQHVRACGKCLSATSCRCLRKCVAGSPVITVKEKERNL